MESIKRFLLEEEGATAVEYGIMVAAIAAVIITIVFSIGTRVNTAFTTVDGAMATGATGG
jgi:pilus assembly protein Flp/PilA